MYLVLLDEIFRVILVVSFAYLAFIGGVSAIKLVLMDMELRQLAIQQNQMLDGLETTLKKQKEE